MTLTAAYEALTYKVKFLYLGETIGAEQSVKYGENLVLPSGEDAGLPNEIRIVGWKRRGDGSIISPSEFDTVARSDTYDAVIETDEAEKLTVSGFRTNGFYLYDKYAAGDDASAIVTFKNGKTFALRDYEYEVKAPSDFADDGKEYVVEVAAKSELFSVKTSFEVEVSAVNKEKISVLFVGNSYSDDTIDLAYNVAKSAGIANIEIADLYYGGCTIDEHIDFATNNKENYIYRFFNEKGELNVSTAIQNGVDLSTFRYGVSRKPWDYIVLQQGSRDSGKPETYDKLQTLISLVKRYATNPNVKIAFNMTWAYREGSAHWAFPYYGTQKKMYDGIITSVRNKVATNENIVSIIPAGTAIQNARTSFVGDKLTRDNAEHLTEGLGRYIDALTFVSKISGVDVDEISYGAGLSADYVAVAKESAKNAIKTPFAVTESGYPPLGDDVIQGKEAMTLTFGSGYYQTDNNDADKRTEPISGDDFSKRFRYTIKFTRETLPVGSIIYVANEWKYRPEGWIGGEPSSPRPAEVTTKYVRVTEAWWGKYTERAFNVSKISGTADIGDVDVSQYFKIYKP